MPAWSKELPIPVTVCDETGIIVEMNDKSIDLFEQDGGVALLGKRLHDCHPEPAKTKLVQMLNNHLPNTYLSVADGSVALIHESPWFEEGIFKGYVEFNIPLPPELAKRITVE